MQICYVLQLRNFAKVCPLPGAANEARTLMRKIREQAGWIEKRRSQCGIDLTDEASTVHQFKRIDVV